MSLSKSFLISTSVVTLQIILQLAACYKAVPVVQIASTAGLLDRPSTGNSKHHAINENYRRFCSKLARDLHFITSKGATELNSVRHTCRDGALPGAEF